MMGGVQRRSEHRASAGNRAWHFVRLVLRYGFEPSRRNVLHWLSWAVTLGVELALVLVLQDGTVYGWEQDLTRTFQRVPGRDVVFNLSSPLTHTLSLRFAIVFVSIVGLVLASGRVQEATLLALTFPLHVLAQFPKALIDRPRPSPMFEGIEGVGGFRSFPSGHAEFVVSFYGLLTYYAIASVDSRWLRAVLLAAWLGLVVATGFGRIALGRHWPIDIIASFVVGLGLLSGLLWLDRACRLARRALASQHR
jgi:undecaprenyl-diphosphatase